MVAALLVPRLTGAFSNDTAGYLGLEPVRQPLYGIVANSIYRMTGSWQGVQLFQVALFIAVGAWLLLELSFTSRIGAWVAVLLAGFLVLAMRMGVLAVVAALVTEGLFFTLILAVVAATVRYMRTGNVVVLGVAAVLLVAMGQLRTAALLVPAVALLFGLGIYAVTVLRAGRGQGHTALARPETRAANALVLGIALGCLALPPMTGKGFLQLGTVQDSSPMVMLPRVSLVPPPPSVVAKSPEWARMAASWRASSEALGVTAVTQFDAVLQEQIRYELAAGVLLPAMLDATPQTIVRGLRSGPEHDRAMGEAVKALTADWLLRDWQAYVRLSASHLWGLLTMGDFVGNADRAQVWRAINDADPATWGGKPPRTDYPLNRIYEPLKPLTAAYYAFMRWTLIAILAGGVLCAVALAWRVAKGVIIAPAQLVVVAALAWTLAHSLPAALLVFPEFRFTWANMLMLVSGAAAAITLLGHRGAWAVSGAGPMGSITEQALPAVSPAASSPPADTRVRVDPASKVPASTHEPRLLIFIVANFAERTIDKVLRRIPSSLGNDYDVEILIIDDGSKDQTFANSAVASRSGDIPFKITVLHNPVNQGYGGNQKIGYHYAIEYGFDFVVLLHGDGQYAPEMLGAMTAPLREGKADAVFGSRMMRKREALEGGMPLYKYFGNRILTRAQNRLLGTCLSEFHSGYRAYSVAALRQLPFERNSNVFHFDTEIIIQLVFAGKRIEEIAIPTYYGDEICRVDGLKYAKDVIKASVQARLQSVNLFYDRRFDCSRVEGGRRYPSKLDFDSTHARVIELVAPGSRVLDLGSGIGAVGAELKKRKACMVVGCDIERGPMTDVYDRFELADLDRGLPAFPSEKLDYILALDVIEHLRNPEDFLDQLRKLAAETGARLILTTANIGFIAMRLSLLLGRFEYGKRGILDLTHTRLFTLRTLQRAMRAAGFVVEQHEGVVVPIPFVLGDTTLSRMLMRINRLLIWLRPSLFGFQLLVVASARPNLETLLASARSAAGDRLEALGGVRRAAGSEGADA